MADDEHSVRNQEAPDRELTIIGATPAGLSLAIAAKQSGLDRTVVIACQRRILAADVIGRYALDIVHVDGPVETAPTHAAVVVRAGGASFTSRAVVDAKTRPAAAPPTGLTIAEGVAERVHLTLDGWSPREQDVLVVGDGEYAAVVAQSLVDDAANVILVLAEDRAERLSLQSRQALFDLEADRRITIFWQSRPEAIVDLLGYPTAVFSDRRTPDLQFDHVVLAFDGAAASPRPGVYALVGSPEASPPLLTYGGAWEHLRSVHWPGTSLAPPPAPFPDPEGTRRIGELREEAYNATITQFDTRHGDLWVLRVRPDSGSASHLPGQYATLGLGYWERRIDDVDEHLTPAQSERLIRRSYSISSPIFDDNGYLADAGGADEIELYVVLVRAAPDRIPALTPRLALKRPGDRIHLGPKIAGRYTSSVVDDPADAVAFLATGTGEAPHNAMIVELLRRGHYGPIVSVVSVRYATDLGYLAQHRELESRYRNYTYVPLTTRDPKRVGEKIYIQDFIARGMLAECLGGKLDPESTHVFLCGNPGMIGLPTWDGDQPKFPEPRGASEVLYELGFTLDRRGVVGRVHHEEYW